jgi:hypothetical protein
LTGGVPAIADSPLTANTTNSVENAILYHVFVDAELDPSISGQQLQFKETSVGVNQT